MKTKRVLPVLLVFVAFSLACNLSQLSSHEATPAAPKEALVTPTNPSLPMSTKTPEATPIPLPLPITYEKAQIGFLSNLYVTYDPKVWEAYTDPSWSANLEGEAEYHLKHRKYDCILEANLGMGAPENWERSVSQKQIGGLIYQVETWRDTNTNEEVLVVYQYPANGQRQDATRIEVVIQEQPQECIADTEAVLALSEKEILK